MSYSNRKTSLKTGIGRALLALAIATVVLPATASADVPWANNEYANARVINLPGTTLPRSAPLGGNNIGADTQPNEVVFCQNARDGATGYFGATLWQEFHPEVNGEVSFTVIHIQDFVSVVWIVPFDSPTHRPAQATVLNYGAPDSGCDAPAFGNAKVTTYVIGGKDYNIQLGGELFGTNPPAQGIFNYDFNFVPDSDADRVLDPSDACPSDAGSTSGCPDRDGDGFIDPSARKNAGSALKVDQCPDSRGPLNGCPDGDGDGVPDQSDACVGAAGPLNGCPDRDGDAVADKDDSCPSSAGRVRGCPDGDGDGFVDSAPVRAASGPAPKFDKCPLRPGPLSGCEVIEADGFLSFRDARKGIKVRALLARNVPKGARVEVRCSRRSCKRQVRQATASDLDARAASTVTFKRLRGKTLKAGTLIEIRVTKRDAFGKYVSYKIKKAGFKKSVRCMNLNSHTPRKVCS